jgi:hypothetical protein
LVHPGFGKCDSVERDPHLLVICPGDPLICAENSYELLEMAMLYVSVPHKIWFNSQRVEFQVLLR